MKSNFENGFNEALKLLKKLPNLKSLWRTMPDHANNVKVGAKKIEDALKKKK